jgi:hypothetical protein
MRTNTDTFPAVYTEFLGYDGFAVSYTDCLRRAALDAIDAALAQLFLKMYRCKEFTHPAPSCISILLIQYKTMGMPL